MTIVEAAGRLRISPRSSVTLGLRTALAARKPDLLQALSAENRILPMPLDRFEKEGCPIRIRVSWCPEHLWLVPGEKHVQTLGRREINRGRIWTACELKFLWSVPSLNAKTAEELGRIKVQFDGEIVAVEGPGERAAEDG
jgi:hypothetical protein